MKYNLKYDVNIMFVIFFKINQHKIYSSYFFVQFIYIYVANVHENVHPFYLSSTISFIQEHVVEYSSMSPNIMSHVLKKNCRHR
jgi:hypothetical protein